MGMGKARAALVGKIIIFGVLGFYLLINLFPIYWMFATSLKTDEEVYLPKPVYFPRNPTFRNYQIIFTTRPFGKYTFNTAYISIWVAVICALFGSLAAYGFSRFRFAGREGLRYLVLATRIFPPIALVIPFFIIFGHLGLIDTLTGQILVNVYMWLPFSIWILIGFFNSLPRELDEAALIDGCSYFQVFSRILFPLIFPGIAATSIIAFMGTWNEFLFNLIMAPTPAAKNLSVGASDFIADMFISWNQMGAGAMITSIPAFVFILFFQKYIVSGLTKGAIKG